MTKTMIKTMSVTLGALVAVAMLLPTVASARLTDAASCDAKSRPPQGLEAKVAAERCKAGDASSISAIEKALDNVKIAQPRP